MVAADNTAKKGGKARATFDVAKNNDDSDGVFVAPTEPLPDKNNNKAKPSYRERVCEPVPDDLSLADIRKVLPREVFEKSNWEAFKCMFTTTLFTSLGIYLLTILPWYLLPLGWAFAGTAATGLFVIGHDCGHLSFIKNVRANNIIGTICFLPLIYPFEAWRIKHNHHHKHTNLLEIDNAWQPFQKSEYMSETPFWQLIYRLVKGPFWYFASIGHQIKEHFFLDTFEESEKERVKNGIHIVYAFAAIFFPTLWYFTGIVGIFKYWFMVWLGYHFWMSTFTMVHHTAIDIPFYPKDKWTPAKAQLGATVHCSYPRWIEYLCHNINVHIPHHISTQIPNYHLVDAHYALKAKFGQYMICSKFTWSMLMDIITKCHLYNAEKNYVPFD